MPTLPVCKAWMIPIYRVHRSVWILKHPSFYRLSGIQNSGKLTYTWNGVSGSKDYCLVVKNDQNRVVITQWYSALPARTTYSKTPRKSLPSGVYTWSILCRNRGHSQLSEQMEFTVCTSLPGKATLVSPKDTIGSKNPIFAWLPVTGATEYRLKVAKAGSPNAPIFDDVYNVEDVFSNTNQICSVGPVLLPGSRRKNLLQVVDSDHQL